MWNKKSRYTCSGTRPQDLWIMVTNTRSLIIMEGAQAVCEKNTYPTWKCFTPNTWHSYSQHPYFLFHIILFVALWFFYYIISSFATIMLFGTFFFPPSIVEPSGPFGAATHTTGSPNVFHIIAQPGQNVIHSGNSHIFYAVHFFHCNYWPHIVQSCVQLKLFFVTPCIAAARPVV